jgi:hypothetical protein
VSRDPIAAAPPPSTPGWTWVALLVGAAITASWAWFLYGFLEEPSAVGRTLVVLDVWIGLAIVGACVGVAAAVGLLRRREWGRTLAWASSIVITLTFVGAVAGVPALIALVASRQSSAH